MSHASLDHFFRLQVARHAPYGAHKPRIAIVPPLKSLWTGLDALCLKLRDHLGPQRPELRGRRARPGQPQQLVQVLFPLRIGLVGALGPPALALRRVHIRNGEAELQRVGGDLLNGDDGMLKKMANGYAQHDEFSGAQSQRCGHGNGACGISIFRYYSTKLNASLGGWPRRRSNAEPPAESAHRPSSGFWL
jgi:hypothetical protein